MIFASIRMMWLAAIKTKRARNTTKPREGNSHSAGTYAQRFRNRHTVFTEPPALPSD